MTPKIFEYSDYKRFLLDWIESRANKGRGEKLAIAKYLKCNPGYVTQVLSGVSHFNLEQTVELARYLKLTEDEIRYFLLLVQKDRAGTQELRNFFKKEIQSSLDSRKDLKKRLNYSKVISDEHQLKYYSSWLYVAIHSALSLSGLSTEQALSNYFNIPESKVSEVIDFLVSSNLVEKIKNGYKSGPISFHLATDAPSFSQHQGNWKIKAMESLSRIAPEDLHYTGVITVGKSDVPKVREILVAAVEEVRSLVKTSKEEELYCYSTDLFAVAYHQ